NRVAPGDGFVVCTYAAADKRRPLLFWCTPLAPDGVFRQLLPVGDGIARICHAAAVETTGCPDVATSSKKDPRRDSAPGTISTFNYRVEAGRTVQVTPSS
ncbi:MAG: hypothetical protein WD825_13075, partial [Gemmatimonadaceae bacterium]